MSATDLPSAEHPPEFNHNCSTQAGLYGVMPHFASRSWRLALTWKRQDGSSIACMPMQLPAYSITTTARSSLCRGANLGLLHRQIALSNCYRLVEHVGC